MSMIEPLRKMGSVEEPMEEPMDTLNTPESGSVNIQMTNMRPSDSYQEALKNQQDMMMATVASNYSPKVGERCQIF